VDKEEWFERVEYSSDNFPTNRDRKISKEELVEEWFQSDLIDQVGYNLD